MFQLESESEASRGFSHGLARLLLLSGAVDKASKDAPLPAEDNGSFSNAILAVLVLGVPWFVERIVPIVRGVFYTYWFLIVIFAPITVGYIGPSCVITARGIFARQASKRPLRLGFETPMGFTKDKIPMPIWHDAYFDGKIDTQGASHLSK